MAPRPAPPSDPAIAEARSLLAAAESAATAEGADHTAAARAAEQAIALLAVHRHRAAGRLRATAWRIRGNALRDRGAPEDLAEAFRSYDAAIAVGTALAGAGDHALRDDLASTWTNRGIALLGEGTPARLADAVHCFDEAVRLRRDLPVAEDPWLAYGLAAAWLNRGDALARFGPAGSRAEAVRSFDEALAVVRHLPEDGHPLFRRRVVVTWTNRGLALQSDGTPAGVAEAVECHRQAVGAIRRGGPAARPGCRIDLATALINLGSALVHPSQAQAGEARHAAVEALALLAGLETERDIAAEAGLRARQVLCRAIADLLAGDAAPGATADDLAGEATDAVDEGMALARRWEDRGADRLRGLARDLFRFGTLMYGLHQPHALAEFLLESLDPQRSPDAVAELEMHAIAEEALALARQQLKGRALGSARMPRILRHVEALHELHAAQTRLAALRPHAGRRDAPGP